MAKAKIIIAAFAAILTVIVVAQNTEAVETRLLFVTVTMPRAVLLLLSFGIGGVVGLLVAFSLSGKRKASG